jgi:hypothetical protein
MGIRTFCRFDELPELGIVLERLVLAHLDAGTEEEILEGVPAHDAVDENAKRVALKINTVIANPEAVEDVTVALELAEIFQFAADDLLGQATEVAENLELQFLGHPRKLGGTGRRENNLKWAHQIVAIFKPALAKLAMLNPRADGTGSFPFRPPAQTVKLF